MPVVSKGDDGWEDENTLYAQLWEYRVMVMSLDHFFSEVVEGNVPLDTNEPWWQRAIIPERVNQYSRPWCALYEGLAHLRERVEGQVAHSLVQIDANLKITYHGRRSSGDGEPLTWVDKENGRF